MNRTFVDVPLKDRGLELEPLKALIADGTFYTALLFQPRGTIEAVDHAVRNATPELMIAKFDSFVKKAKEVSCDLAIAPEYSCPWTFVARMLTSGTFPKPGAAWAFGCESITQEDFLSFTRSHPNVEWIHPDIERATSGHFLDPFCYFLPLRNPQEGGRRIAVVTQFKTHAMADRDHHFERDRLCLGDTKYVLRNGDNSIYLSTLICSDALQAELDDLPSGTMHPYLILHPQLNTDPSHPAFRNYRFDSYLHNRNVREILCLNWARGTTILGAPTHCGGSALYTNSPAIDLSAQRLNHNHKYGLYYTRYNDTRSHAFLLNYDEHVFLFRSTKSSQAAAMGVVQQRTGPEMLQLYKWAGNSWTESGEADDGFTTACNAMNDPLWTTTSFTVSDQEWLLCLSTGWIEIKSSHPWVHPDNIPSYCLTSAEAVCRFTFTHHPDLEQRESRLRRLQQFSVLVHSILPHLDTFDHELDDLVGKCQLVANPAERAYRFNVQRDDGLTFATLVYVGQVPSQTAERVFNDLAKALKSDQRRLVVWFHDGIRFRAHFIKGPPSITDDFAESRTSITRGDD